jgi:hypothetical protein
MKATTAWRLYRDIAEEGKHVWPDESIPDDCWLRVGDARRRTGSRTDDEGGDRMVGGGLSCGEADDDRLSAKVPEGPVFETTGSTLDSGGHDCAIEGSNVSARSPTNFGFAARQPPGSRVRMWRSLQTRRHRGGSERRPDLSHKWYRVVEGEPDRRHLHRALYLCWRRLPNSGRHGESGLHGRFRAGFAGFKGRAFQMATCRHSSIA